MKTIRTKVYQFSELSESAKQTAINNYRDNNHEPAWTDENRESMIEFAKIFPIKLGRWSVGGRGEDVPFTFTSNDEIEQLSGVRLATYIWNNYKDEIYSKKYYTGYNKLTDEKVSHPRIESKLIRTGPNAGKYGNYYYSGITIEKYNCPLTGFWMDNEILDEVWKFIDKPDSRDFKELLTDCFEAWIKAWNDDVESQNTDEYISDAIISNTYDFTKDGKLFNQ